MVCLGVSLCVYARAARAHSVALALIQNSECRMSGWHAVCMPRAHTHTLGCIECVDSILDGRRESSLISVLHQTVATVKTIYLATHIAILLDR